MTTRSAVPRSRSDAIRALLDPRSVAVVGASEEMRYGGNLFACALRAQGRVNVYPINPKYRTVQGVTCYPTLNSLPETPDTVVIVVPHTAVLDVLEQAGRVGARAALVISAGFSERGTAERRDLQREMTEMARELNLRICGPNCLGIADIGNNVWLCGSSKVLRTDVAKIRVGGVGIISQSGATAFSTLFVRAVELGIGINRVISTGNEADLDFVDFARYLVEDDRTSVIAGYVEGFKDAAKFVDLARAAAERGKPIVLAKVGRSSSGERAARAHTASFTGSDAVYQGLFEQHGVVRVDDYEELLQVSQLLATTRPPRSRGVGLMSHSGGIASMTSDLLGAHGIDLPALSDRTRESISVALKGFGWAANPADLTGQVASAAFGSIVGAMAAEPGIATVVVASAGDEGHVAALLEQRSRIDESIVYLWTGAQQDAKGLQALKDASVPVFYTPSSLARALTARDAYFAWRGRRADCPPAQPVARTPAQELALARARGLGRRALSEHESKQLLRAWGISTTREALVQSAEEAAEAARSIGYPVALKVDSAAIPHKTELGVVRLAVRDENELVTAYGEVTANALAHVAAAEIGGVLVQEHVRGGVEVMLGLSYDAQVGPVVLCGLGGIMVEALGRMTIRACPLSAGEARDVVARMDGAALLTGLRGAPPADVDALVETLVSLSRLGAALAGELEDLDVNPLLVLPEGQGALVADALVTFRSDGRS